MTRRRLVGKIDRKRTTDNRLDSRAGYFFGEFKRGEKVAGIGERKRRLPIGLRKLGELPDLQRAFEQRIGRMNMEVDEAHRPCEVRHKRLRFCAADREPM